MNDLSKGPSLSGSPVDAPHLVSVSIFPGAPATQEPLLLLDDDRAPDLLGTQTALLPLVQLAAHGETPTPFMIGVIGPAGSGKSFALARLSAAVKNLSLNARALPSPYLSRIVLAPINVALAGDPTLAIARSAYAAIAADYPAFAAEAAHASADPVASAKEAADRHHAIGKELETERAARDEVESRAARLTETLIYETPRSRLDSFIRARRSAIDARLGRFGLRAGDVAANYRDLISELAGSRRTSTIGVALRSIWAYRSQARLLLGALIAFVAAFGLHELRMSFVANWLSDLGDLGAKAGQILQSQAEAIAAAAAIFALLGGAFIAANIWRAARFSAILGRGLRLLNMDVQERRGLLATSAARLNRRVDALNAEADAAGKHAETMAARALSHEGAPATPGPAFAQGDVQAERQGALAFMAAVSAMIGGARPAPTPAPQRLIFTLDNLDALPPEAAQRCVEALRALSGAGCAGIVVCDPSTTFAGTDEDGWRERLEKWFHATFFLRHASEGGGALVARLLNPAKASPAAGVDASAAQISEPITAVESALLATLAPLAAKSPRHAKRFLNAYRLMRIDATPRPVSALMLAIVQGGDARNYKALKRVMSEAVETIADPDSPPALVEAMRAARAANNGSILLKDVIAAAQSAQRFTLGIPLLP